MAGLILGGRRELTPRRRRRWDPDPANAALTTSPCRSDDGGCRHWPRSPSTPRRARPITMTRREMGRLGLEPRSDGLTCRTGSHRPPAARRALRSGPSLRPRLDVRAGSVWPLRALRARAPRRGLPADCPIPRIVTAWVPRALRGSQQTAADKPAVSRLALRTEVPCSTD